SQNEIDAAKLVHLEYFNTQDQPKFLWPASFVVARAYLDQVARSNGLAPDRLAATRTALARAERLSGNERREVLLQLATQLEGDAQGAPQGTLRTLATEVRDLAGTGAGEIGRAACRERGCVAGGGGRGASVTGVQTCALPIWPGT